ncbi:MAG: hypothetical protein SFV32_04085 [Opitutaceae bacterium]|nr:hypothetical protein [Opitutaceae bacterium]
MIQSQKPQERQVTLEDLLRLKRAERPAPEFWVNFEAELRRKQLAAAIEQRRPWWHISLSSRFLRLGVPVGAAAAVAFAWVSLRKPHAVADAPVGVETNVAESHPISTGADSSKLTNALPDQSESGGAVVAVASSEPSPQVVVASVQEQPLVRESQFRESLKIAPPKSHDVVVTLGLPNVRKVLDVPTQSVLQAAVLAESNAVRHPDVWQDSRRARLMAYAESSLGPNQQEAARSNRTRERVASRLNEEALSDSIRRLGMAEGRLSIRF